MTKEKINDFTLRITSANKTEMVAILYEMAVIYLESAKESLENGNNQSFREEIVRAKNVIKELQASTDTSLELGVILLKILVFCSKELTKAYVSYDAETIDEAIKMLSTLKEAFSEAGKKDKSGAVMEHVQEVYSGLTYNRYSKNESFVGDTLNRGILA